MRRTSYDREADALYLQLNDAAVVRTVTVDPGTLVDLDEVGGVVGIEVLQVSRLWPLDQIVATDDLDPDAT